MNCSKCNQAIEEGRVFCTHCGHLNDSVHNSRKEKKHDTESGTQPRLYTTPKWNVLAIVAGVLLVLSYLLPWHEFRTKSKETTYSGIQSSIDHIKVAVNVLQRGIFSGLENSMTLKDGEYVKSTAGDAIANSLYLFTGVILECIVGIGSLVTILCWLAKSRFTVPAATVVAVSGIIYIGNTLYRNMNQPMQYKGVFNVWTLQVGFYVLSIGIACMLVYALANVRRKQ